MCDVLQECQQSAVNQPTWTGRSGGAGLGSGTRPRFGTAANSRMQHQASSASISGASLEPQVGLMTQQVAWYIPKYGRQASSSYARMSGLALQLVSAYDTQPGWSQPVKAPLSLR